ncbi:MAG: radical SAM protein, partial [Bacteroidales bacterium]|nr:radical SAM protein [Bacteroidales bacterium]
MIYLAWWFFRARFFGRRAPLQTVLFISDLCNLECRHCSVYNKVNPHVSTYARIKEQLEYAYSLGSRFVDFEGGEVTIWRDGDYRINDLIDLAREIGFFSATITTNAQLPFAGNHADSIWVSRDGYGR